MRWSGLWALWLASAACGGIAVVDPPGEGAGGGSSSSGTGGAPVGSVVTSATAASGGSGSLCQQACDRYGACLGGNNGNCVGGCSSINGNCAPQHQSWLGCMLGLMDPGTCALPADCQMGLQSYLSCEGFIDQNSAGPCFADDAGGCGCQLYGVEGETYDTYCQGSACTCSISGEEVGQCDGGAGINECDPNTGCCAVVFWLNGFGP